MAAAENHQTWYDAVQAFDKQDFAKSLTLLAKIKEPTSQILFDIAIIHLQMGSVSQAQTYFLKAVEKDKHLAVAYFKLACTLFDEGKYTDAAREFERCLADGLQGRSLINYTQLGMKCELLAFKASYNAGLSYGLSGTRLTRALELMVAAKRADVPDKHRSTVDRTLDSLDEKVDFTKFKLFYVSGDLFRPKAPEKKPQKFIADSKVIAGVDKNAGFSGNQNLEKGAADKPPPQREPGRSGDVTRTPGDPRTETARMTGNAGSDVPEPPKKLPPKLDVPSQPERQPPQNGIPGPPRKPPPKDDDIPGPPRRPPPKDDDIPDDDIPGPPRRPPPKNDEIPGPPRRPPPKDDDIPGPPRRPPPKDDVMNPPQNPPQKVPSTDDIPPPPWRAPPRLRDN